MAPVHQNDNGSSEGMAKCFFGRAEAVAKSVA